MKHMRSFASTTVVVLVLISLCAVSVSPLSVNAIGGSSANVQAPATVGTPVAGAPTVCTQDANSLDVFAKGTDGALWHTSSQGSGWSAWASLGGSPTSSPAATSRNTGGLTVFARDSDGAIWYRDYVAGSWGKWVSIGGQTPAGTGPAVCSWRAGRLDVFAKGTNGGLYHKWYTGTSWSNWEYLGGVLTSSPAATSRNPGGLTVFTRGNDDGVWYRDYVAGSWGKWVSIGGQIPAGTGPAVCSWGGGRLDVFARGTDGAMWHKSYDTATSWSNWNSLGGVLTSSPAATSPANGVIHVFVRGSDSGLWHKGYDPGLYPTTLWSSWTSIGAMSQSEAQTIYYVPQAGSTWANQGTVGANYNAYVSTPSLLQTRSNGYPYWGDIGKNDFIYVPAGSATNNQNVTSWEIGFHFNGLVTGQRYQKIWDKAAGGFSIYIDTYYGAESSLLTIYRATTSGSKARWYIPTNTMLRVGHNYYVQISWNTSAGPGKEPYPTVWIGEDGNAPVHQTRWDETLALSGTGSWYNDAVGGANLGNMASNVGINVSAKMAWLNGGFFVYRQYNSIIDFSSGGSWYTDKVRWT
jgi:hypothetical protein